MLPVIVFAAAYRELTAHDVADSQIKAAWYIRSSSGLPIPENIQFASIFHTWGNPDPHPQASKNK